MQPKIRSTTWVAALVSMILILGVAPAAVADLFGGDLPLLSGILAQATQAATALGSALDTLRRTYQDARRVAGYAEDAVAAYSHFKAYNATLFKQDVQQAFEASYPDIGYFRREVSGAGSWAQGSGELQRLTRLCLLGPSGNCRPLQEALSVAQTRDALDKTFGRAPKGADDLHAVDHESAVALAAGSAQQGRSQRARALSDALIQQCQGSSGDDNNLAACQAAGSSAQIQALHGQADIADQVSETNRLQTLQLQQRNQERKRELEEATERRALVLEGVDRAARPPIPVRTEGYNLLEQNR